MQHIKTHLLARPLPCKTILTLPCLLFCIQMAGGCATAKGEHPQRGFNSSVIAQTQPIISIEDGEGALVKSSAIQTNSSKESDIISLRMPPLIHTDKTSTKEIVGTNSPTQTDIKTKSKNSPPLPQTTADTKAMTALKEFSKSLSQGENIDVEEVIDADLVPTNPQKNKVDETFTEEVVSLTPPKLPQQTPQPTDIPAETSTTNTTSPPSTKQVTPQAVFDALEEASTEEPAHFHYDPKKATEYVEDSYKINGIYINASTPDELYTNCKVVDGTFLKNNPRPGDLVFFHNTQDLNQDGKRNDWFSWVAIVVSRKPNGEITFIGWRNNALETSRMNLTQQTKNPSTTPNSLLRRDNEDTKEQESASNYADQLFAGYCSLLNGRDHFDLIQEWHPLGD